MQTGKRQRARWFFSCMFWLWYESWDWSQCKDSGRVPRHIIVCLLFPFLMEIFSWYKNRLWWLPHILTLYISKKCRWTLGLNSTTGTILICHDWFTRRCALEQTGMHNLLPEHIAISSNREQCYSGIQNHAMCSLSQLDPDMKIQEILSEQQRKELLQGAVGGCQGAQKGNSMLSVCMINHRKAALP